MSLCYVTPMYVPILQLHHCTQLVYCLCNLQVVLTVAIAFIVEAFALKIELARQKYVTRKGMQILVPCTKTLPKFSARRQYYFLAYRMFVKGTFTTNHIVLLLHVVADQYTDDKYIERYVVSVTLQELLTIEALKRPYWSWELPYTARKKISVSVCCNTHAHTQTRGMSLLIKRLWVQCPLIPLCCCC